MTMIVAFREKEKNSPKAGVLLRMQLECKFNVMLDFTLKECLTFIYNFIEASPRVEPDSVPDLLRIFRMVFDRYTFTRDLENR